MSFQEQKFNIQLPCFVIVGLWTIYYWPLFLYLYHLSSLTWVHNYYSMSSYTFTHPSQYPCITLDMDDILFHEAWFNVLCRGKQKPLWRMRPLPTLNKTKQNKKNTRFMCLLAHYLVPKWLKQCKWISIPHIRHLHTHHR